jgi:peptide/nickel transport system permease protein
VLAYIARRLLTAVFIVMGSSFIVYLLMANAGDPLEWTLGITNPVEREAAVRSVTEALNLDVNPIARYFLWLGDVLRGDFGVSARTNQPVNDELVGRLLMTLKLVSASTVLAIVIGISIGIVTALRQYSGFDYVVTFFTFVFFSLPVFWVAVMLKSFGAIQFNDWLRAGAEFQTWAFVLGTLAAAGIAYSITGGQTRRRLISALITGAVALAVLIYISASGWMTDPGFGPVVTGLFAVAIAFGVTAITAGLGNTKARNSSLTAAVLLGIIGYFPLQAFFDSDSMNIWRLLGFGLVTILLGTAVGYAYGGYDKGLSARTASIVAFLVGIVLFLDRAMRSWADYSANPTIRNRPIKTIGDREYRLEGDFWIHTNDLFSHLILPTMALMLISLATYTRYSRASMLEVLNQDYIRTARSKGLPERSVILRHGFRNAMIPLATIVAFDIGGILGGAVITETVFEWNAMGRMFIQGLRDLDPNPVMAFFVVISLFAVVANLVADLAYAALDPRIRIGE